MRWYVAEGILPCVQTRLMVGTEVVHESRTGFMSLTTQEPLRDDAIFRIYSNTKIVTSIALMMLHEENLFELDDPLSKHLPEFADMTVVDSDAASINDARPCERPILIRHVLSHTAGLSYGFLDPTGVVDSAYAALGIGAFSATLTLEDLCDRLAQVPLCSEPGTEWRYSFATDVCARLVEVLSGQQFDDFLKLRILDPLDMDDTSFWVPEAKADRFTTMYTPVNPLDPMLPGLAELDSAIDGRDNQPRNLLSGGAGLVSTMDDYSRFITMIISGGEWNGSRLVQPETLHLMRTNQIPPDAKVGLGRAKMTNTGFGLGFALKLAPNPDETSDVIGEYHWGGMAGTHSWMSPESGLTGLCFTQRLPAFHHPFSQDFRRLAYNCAR